MTLTLLYILLPAILIVAGFFCTTWLTRKLEARAKQKKWDTLLNDTPCHQHCNTCFGRGEVTRSIPLKKVLGQTLWHRYTELCPRREKRVLKKLPTT